MRLALSLAFGFAFAWISAGAVARGFEPRQIDPPLIDQGTPVSQHGLSFRIPGTWKTSHIARDKDGVVTVRASAVKQAFEAINLEVVVHAYPRKIAPSLKEVAHQMVEVEKDGSDAYTEAAFTPVTLGGDVQGLAARYEHTPFGADRPYRHRVDLFAVKSCGSAWVCVAYCQTLALNAVPAQAVLEMVLANATYKRSK